MEAPSGGYEGTLEPVEINDFNIWFLHHFPKVSLRACNEHAVRMSHNLKNRRHGIFKARSPYAFEGHLGEEFKPVWEGGQVALLNLSNRCFVSATKNGQLLSDCNTSSPGPHELFDVESRNELVAFRSAHGTYIGLESGGEKLVCSATAAGSSELFQIRLKAYIQVNNGHYVSAERNHSLIAQRFRPGIPARGDSFILEVGTTHCSFRSQYNRYWVAESNGNLSAVTPASSSRKSAREEFKLEGYRSDLLEPEHIYFGIRTTHGTFVISEDDKIVTVSHDAIQKNVAMASRVGYCFTDHLFEILPQPSSPLSPTSSSSTSSASSPSSSADFSRSPSFSWAKQSFPPHTLATSSNSGSTHTRRERTESESGNGSPEDSIRYRIGARLRQRVDRKLHRGAPSRDGEGEETNNKQSGGRGGRTTPNAFPHRSKSLSDHLERSGGRDRDLLAPNPEQQVKRADTEPVDRRHAGVAKSSEALPTYSDRGRRKQENSSGSGGASGGRSGDRMRSVVGSDGDFEAIEVFVDDEEQSDDIEDGWEEITEGSSDDYGYFEARLRAQQGTKLKSPPPKPNEALSPRSAAAAVEAKTSTAVTTTGFDQMAGEWVIDPRDLQLSDRVLGKGFFGEVKKGRWRGTPVAAKIIYRELFRSKSDEQLFDKEVRMLRSLHHPHVIQFLGVCQFKEKRQRCIVTELMEKGSLHDLLRNEATLFKDPLLRVRIARDIAKGMCYLHMSDPPTLHRDLTSKNILLDRFLRAKIADFGLSRFKEENGVFTQGCGALAFMAPEVYRGEAYSEKADVYSYAIILWEMWNMGKYPHEVAWMDQLAYAAECALRDYRPQLSDDIPEAWRQLITLCWHKSPSARPSFSHILNILKQLTRITRGGGGGVEYLDLGDYMAEALLLEEAENGTSSPRHKNDKPLAANAPTARDNHHSQQPPISPRANQQAPQHQQQRRNDNRRSGESEAEEADDEKRNEGGGEEREDSGYWSERKVEKRLKKAALHTITPRSAQPPTVQRTGGGGGSSGRGCDVNYVDQDRATSMHYAITGDEFQFAEQEVVGGVTMEQRHGEGEHEEAEVVDNAIVQTVSTSGVDASSSYSAPLFVKEETIYEDVDFLVPQSQERTVSPDRNREGWLLVMAKRKTP